MSPDACRATPSWAGGGNGDAQSVLVMQWGELDLNLVRRGARMTGVVEHFERLLAAAREEFEE